MNDPRGQLCSLDYCGVVAVVSSPGSYPGGRRFESCPRNQYKQKYLKLLTFIINFSYICPVKTGLGFLKSKIKIRSHRGWPEGNNRQACPRQF